MHDESLLAPRRGRYDRRSTPEQRLRAQRGRLLRAVALAFVEGQPNVSRVVALARAGRASFYEFFDDFEHAIALVRSSTAKSLERTLNDALLRERAPVAALRALSTAFSSAVRNSPEAALVTLAATGTQTSALGSCFERALRRWLAEPGSAALITRGSDSTRVLLATGAAEAFARRAARDALAHAPAAADAGRELADALLRLFR